MLNLLVTEDFKVPAFQNWIEDLSQNAMVLTEDEFYENKQKTYLIITSKVRSHLLDKADNFFLCRKDDVYLEIPSVFRLVFRIVRQGLTFMHYSRKEVSEELCYLELCRKCLVREAQPSRNALVHSTFGEKVSFDISKHFPLITTKRVFFRGVVEELLFFLRGQTNSKILSDKGVSIWSANTSSEILKKLGLNYQEGEMGPMYGAQWRNFNSQNIDQLDRVVSMLRSDPFTRRAVFTSFNPAEVDKGCLYPCHTLIGHFSVRGNSLDYLVYNRSCDLACGFPFNLASSALLLIIVAKLVSKEPGTLTMMMGDVHVYDSHTDLLWRQVLRPCYNFPKLSISKSLQNLKDVEELCYEDFTLSDYNCHRKLEYKMIP